MPRYDFFNRYGFRTHVTVARIRAEAARTLEQLTKGGRRLSPVTIEGRRIAATFWGKAWCENLERYSDFANRLPRGRSYVRHGAVVDLDVVPGHVRALVRGSETYEVDVAVQPVASAAWDAIRRDCSGAIDTVVELLQGRLSAPVMTRLCEPEAGLFPSPAQLRFSCSCPDQASMCKHVAAVLYGIGARLDHDPGVLFTLRKIDRQELIAEAGAALSTRHAVPSGARVLADDDLAGIFGIELAGDPIASGAAAPASRSPAAVRQQKTKKRKSPAAAKGTARRTGAAGKKKGRTARAATSRRPRK
jgi:uncharacterized Zn finger protein